MIEIEFRLLECPHCKSTNVASYAVKKRGTVRLYNCKTCNSRFRVRIPNPRHTPRRTNPLNGRPRGDLQTGFTTIVRKVDDEHFHID
jgi:hypothetical protein